MKSIRPLLTTCITSLFLTGCITVNADSIDYEATETLSLNTSGLTRLDIDAHAGFLTIEGDDSLDSIEVTADIAAYNKNYKLSLDKKGNKALLIADPNPNNISNWFGVNSPKIDLTVKLPKGMSLSVEDGSGNIQINNIDGKIFVDDGSGNLVVKNIGGSVEIEDGSGNIELSNVQGDIKIDDGSGDLDIQHASSDVDIEDGSGQIELVDIGGKIKLDDGSGDLLVKGAKGHVTIDDGSGDIELVDLENGLTVLNAGSGGFSIYSKNKE